MDPVCDMDLFINPIFKNSVQFSMRLENVETQKAFPSFIFEQR